jgi:hypothetical protein
MPASLSVVHNLSFEEGQGVDGGSPCSGPALALVPPASPFSHQGAVIIHGFLSHLRYGAEE